MDKGRKKSLSIKSLRDEEKFVKLLFKIEKMDNR